MRRKYQHRINFDEVISDSIPSAEGLAPHERPLGTTAFYTVFGLTALIAFVFLGRIMLLGAIRHDRYVERANANIMQEIPIIAARGIITDRNGEPLVANEAVFSVLLRTDEMIRQGEKEKVLQIAQRVLALDPTEVERTIENTDLESIADIILAKNIRRDQALAIRASDIQSLVILSDYRRAYTEPAFSHVVGYVGLVNADDLRNNRSLVLNDYIGRAGLEAYYDDVLRGKNGAIAVARNAFGELEEIEQRREPIPGKSVQTTIDSEFQKYFYNRMLQGLAALGRTAGVGIAINPQNGEILALVSFPSFDSNNIAPALENPYQPLFNRAISGLYNPGSTIKPVHAAAALHEGVVSPETQIFSAGFIEIPNPYFPDQPSRFLDWKPHGWVNVYSALARSSNVYFYAVGGGYENVRGIGIDKLREYWRAFGFGNRTGIDLPGEAAGFLPSPEDKEKRTGEIWRVGDTYNVSIGQGDLRITPIELLTAVTAIANNGKAYTPHIRKSNTASELLDVSWLSPDLAHVRKGMEDAVAKPYGTAYALADLPIQVAAKTGSAQIANNTKTNALFVGYAPSENPEIAILVLIEDAREGSLNTIPIAEDVFRWYYNNRLAGKE